MRCVVEAEANVTERIEEAIAEFAKHTCLKFRALLIENFEYWPIDYLLFNISADVTSFPFLIKSCVAVS